MLKKPGTRTRNIYNPDSEISYKLSRSKLELFVGCKRCFYIDRRKGVGRPSGLPFTLNKAVDTLLKKEFDIHRAKNQAHPLMKEYGIDAVPFKHEDLNKWRENFEGIEYLHKPTNLIITGAIDDIWVNPKGELIVVDYKATSTTKEINIDDEYREGYKRQLEIYQWLLRQNGFKVSNLGYFVYVNGRADRESFDAKLEFDIQILPYEGNNDWVEGIIYDAYQCLNSENIPQASLNCEYCVYIKARKTIE